jgi:carbonic anhydrase/acetyltransferase-like protein (isoleucine patch superfamily)
VGAKIGENCKLTAYCEIRENVTMGENTTMGSRCTISANALIGSNTVIKYGFVLTDTPNLKEGDIKVVKGVGDNVLIGANVTLVPGFSISNNSIIGACSQVKLKFNNMTFNNHCSFDPITGIKTYKTKEACDFAYGAQLQAYALNVAPKVITRIDDYSYQTDIADTSFFMENFKPNVYYNKVFPDLHKKLVNIFKSKPNKAGPDGVDLARHNIGLYEGRVVMIDFY